MRPAVRKSTDAGLLRVVTPLRSRVLFSRLRPLISSSFPRNNALNGFKSYREVHGCINGVLSSAVLLCPLLHFPTIDLLRPIIMLFMLESFGPAEAIIMLTIQKVKMPA